MDATMEHLNGIELVDYIGGQVSSERQRQIAAHLNTCGDCRRRCHEVRQNWRLLGEWQTDLAQTACPAPAHAGARDEFPGQERPRQQLLHGHRGRCCETRIRTC